MQHVAAFDIGSTNFRYAVGTTDGELSTEPITEPTDASRLIEQIEESVVTLQELATEPLDAVCIASTGLVNHERGLIEKFDTRDGEPNQYGLDVARAIASRFDVTTFVENDVNAATLGEYYFGTDQPQETMLYVSIGSGIGAGILADGTLIRGEHGRAGEVGMMIVTSDRTLESSGIAGSWEAYCSGEGIKQFVRWKLSDEDRETSLRSVHEPTAVDLFDAVRDGDPIAREYLNEINEYNTICVASLSNVFDPGSIAFGGSVAVENADLLLDPIGQALSDRVLVSPPELRISSLGSSAGLIGALALCDHCDH